MRPIALTYCPACSAAAFQKLNAKQFRCDVCGFVYFQNVAAAAGAVIESADQLLIVQRAKDPDLGKLDLPGGFVDPGESLEQALVRELQEELGISVPVEDCGQYFCSSVNEYFYKGVVYHSLDMFFLIRFEQPPPITPADDVGDYLWLAPADIDLDAIAFPSVRDAIRCYRARYAATG